MYARTSIVVNVCVRAPARARILEYVCVCARAPGFSILVPLFTLQSRYPYLGTKRWARSVAEVCY